MKKVILHALGAFNIKNKEYLLAEDHLILKDFLTGYLLENQEQLGFFFPQGDDTQAVYIIFINGCINRDKEYVLKDGDKILITPMMGGG